MQFSVDKQKFLEKLTLVQGVAERKTTMPVLSSILLTSTDGIVRITATDLETTLTTQMSADVSHKSSIAVPARKLFEIVRELPDGLIEINEIKNSWIELNAGNGNYKIAGLPSTDFPQIPEVAVDGLFTIDSLLLDDMISKTVYCVSSDDMRRNLCGICFEKSGQNNLRLVATDGHRLSFVENSSSDDVKLLSSVIVPKKAVLELRKILKQSEPIQIGFESNFFAAVGEDTTIFSRLIDADFPDYRQVVPEETEFELEISRDQFLSSLKRVCVFSSERTKSVKVTFDKESIVLKSVSQDVGEAKEDFEVSYDGGLKEIGFSGNYLIEALESIDKEDVIFGLSDELSPVLIKPKNEENYICIVMPMRI